jgi:hypothetical protein
MRFKNNLRAMVIMTAIINDFVIITYLKRRQQQQQQQQQQRLPFYRGSTMQQSARTPDATMKPCELIRLGFRVRREGSVGDWG